MIQLLKLLWSCQTWEGKRENPITPPPTGKTLIRHFTLAPAEVLHERSHLPVFRLFQHKISEAAFLTQRWLLLKMPITASWCQTVGFLARHPLKRLQFSVSWRWELQTINTNFQSWSAMGQANQGRRGILEESERSLPFHSPSSRKFRS